MSAEFVLPLTLEERQILLRVMEHELGETRVEAHHTDNLQYRESVHLRANLIRGILQKLQGLTPS
jgi:hypothetical protein